MDRLRSMEVFVAAAKTGSYAAAAVQLGMSPQMVARYVQALEERLKVRLLNRTTRRQSLTDVGRLYLERCISALEEVDAAEGVASIALLNPQGRLRISAPQQFGSHSLMDMVRKFLNAYPEVDVELNLTDRVVNLIDEGYEVAFRIGPVGVSDSSSIVVRPLKPYQMVICASPTYLAKAGIPKQPQDLAQHQCLGYMHWDRAVFHKWTFTRGNKSYPVHTFGRLSVNDAVAQLRAAEQGLGILLGAEDLVSESMSAGRLVRLLASYRAPWMPFNLLYPADRQKTMKLKRFIDEAISAFGD